MGPGKPKEPIHIWQPDRSEPAQWHRAPLSAENRSAGTST